MHIAVFDDNIADRKQTERLLKRQSDRYQNEGKEHFYIDSYGNMEALMRFPQMYDIIFIDMQNPVSEDSHFKNGFDVAMALFEAGGIKNIVMCSSKHDYEQMATEAGIHDKMLYLKKAIKVKELEDILTECEIRLGTPEVRLELRGETETIYAVEDDIVFAKTEGMYKVKVYLTENRSITIISDIYNLYEQCTVFKAVCPVSQNAMINVRHVVSESLGSVTMDTGDKVKVSLPYKGNIKLVRKRLAAEEKK
ncbi:MAG: hypothetical protein E7302_10655 [Butyrivibrio sp.]|jgi:DNA-binding LytR/AlgR family response regulator|nr:hypothetical protein [Butyrivibrio sp.]